MKTFSFHGHTVQLLNGKITCDTCSLPMVICKAIEFMAEHQIHNLVVDGTEVKRLK